MNWVRKGGVDPSLRSFSFNKKNSEYFLGGGVFFAFDGNGTFPKNLINLALGISEIFRYTHTQKDIMFL